MKLLAWRGEQIGTYKYEHKLSDETKQIKQYFQDDTFPRRHHILLFISIGWHNIVKCLAKLPSGTLFFLQGSEIAECTDDEPYWAPPAHEET